MAMVRNTWMSTSRPRFRRKASSAPCSMYSYTSARTAGSKQKQKPKRLTRLMWWVLPMVPTSAMNCSSSDLWSRLLWKTLTATARLDNLVAAPIL
uniref:Uncharacterized protein n=1 Tax=Arundo donax TaxID=35708 RepID=A0A0A8Y2J0_ARUDO